MAPGRERPVDHVAVAGDPADVGRAPVEVFVAEVEDPLGGLLHEEVVAGRGVLDALGLAGRAAGVEDEQRGFAIHGLGRAVGRGLVHQVVPPEIAARLSSSRRSPCGGAPRTFPRWATFPGPASTFSFSGICRPRRQPESAVICSLAAASLLRSAMASAGKAGEDHAMHGADPRRRAWRSSTRAPAACRSRPRRPGRIPSDLSTLANRHTSWCSIW